MVKYKLGDIFSLQLPNQEYVFGKITLDVTPQCVKPKLIQPGSPLFSFEDTVLVEIYKTTSKKNEFIISEVLINGVFIDPLFIKKGIWTIVSNQDVDSRQVEFPEALISFENHALFRKGEITLPIALDEEELRKINVYPTILPPVVLIDICLYYLNLKHLINPEYLETSQLNTSDLRFSSFRRKIYEMLGEDDNQSYFDMSKRLGYDITRFYKK